MNRKQMVPARQPAAAEQQALAATARADGQKGAGRTAGASAAAAPNGAAQADRIREAAYRLYEARGHVDGHDVEDWLAAEAALNGSAR